MSNMSYCRFENTTPDFKDCLEALYDNDLESLSESEQRYAKRLIKLAKEMAEDFGHLVED